MKLPQASHYSFIALILAFAIPATAATITDNTGFGTYQIFSDTISGEFLPDGTNAIVVTLLGNDWFAIPGANWIAPDADQSNASRPGGVGECCSGSAIYRTTIDLTGLDPSTAVANITFAADDAVFISLNGGAETGFSGPGLWSTSTAFTINSGFTTGLNTLDFRVVNASAFAQYGPTGLNAAVTIDADPVPEPASIVPLSLAILAGGLILRRRRASAIN